MAETKKYLDYEGLKTYHEKAKSEYDGKYALKGETSDVDLSNYPTNDGVDKKISDAIANDIDPVFSKKDETVDLDTLKQVVAESKHVSAKIVETLPGLDSAVANVIYLVKKDGDINNVYAEYLFIDGDFELIGDTSTDVDLGDYFTKKEVQAAIDKAVAGMYIESISNDDIDLLFKSLPEGFVPYPANGFYPSPDNFLRVWAGEELLAEIDSPTKINKVYPPTKREDFTYNNKGVTRVEYPKSITRLENGSFTGHLLTSAIIPGNISSIEKFALSDGELTSVTIPNSVTSIGDHAFTGNKLQTVSIPNSVTNIGANAFEANQLTSVSIPDSITNIEEGTFSFNQLTSVSIPNSVTNIEYDAFMDNQLTTVTIPDSVTSIESNAFAANPLKTVYMSKDTKFETDSFPESAEIIYRD